jgi:hypothetical protein
LPLVHTTGESRITPPSVGVPDWLDDDPDDRDDELPSDDELAPEVAAALDDELAPDVGPVLDEDDDVPVEAPPIEFTAEVQAVLGIPALTQASKALTSWAEGAGEPTGGMGMAVLFMRETASFPTLTAGLLTAGATRSAYDTIGIGAAFAGGDE